MSISRSTIQTTRYRVRDSRGRILFDLLHRQEARDVAKFWNSRPIGKQFPARVIPLDVSIREVPR